jgi:hypothetical protein
VRRLDGDDLSLEDAQAVGRAVEGVTLRHGARRGAVPRGSPRRGEAA